MGGCFSPTFKDGDIQCGPNDSCPPGLQCHGGLCYAGPPPIDAPSGFALTISVGGNGTGTVTSSPAGISCPSDCTENYLPGTMVTLTATAATTSTFVGWSGACTGTSTCTVTVNDAVNVTANFALEDTLVVALAGNGTGFVTSTPAGISCGTDCMESYTPGTMVTLNAAAVTGSQFGGWSGGGCSGIGSCVVTVDAAKMVTATFTLTTQIVTVTPAGNGAGVVTSAPTGIDCGTTCNQAYNYNTVVTLTAVPNTGSRFTGWSGGGCSGTSTCVITVTAATNVTATFTLQQNALTVAEAGNGAGTVSSNPTGITCPGTCSAPYDYNTTVTLSATPATGSVFTGWSGGGCTGTSACVVSVTAATTVTATFTLTTPALTVAPAGNGTGTVTSTPAGISCGTSCSSPFDYGTMVTLDAVPATGSTFTGWSGGGCTGTGSCIVTVTAATTVTATFTLQTFALTITPGGTGAGTVTSAPAGISCGSTCMSSFNYGQMVTLSASPSAGSTFTGWSGGGCGGTGTCVVTMTAAATVTPTFTLSTYLLTVQPAGTGTGNVSSSPAGIDCGADCTEIYGFGTVVTLTATPTTGSTFTGWSGGGCSGTSTCVITISSAATVTATFTLTTQALTITPTGTGTGSVTSSPAGISCNWNGSAATGTCNFSFPYGTSVTLTASANSSSSFTAWSGGGCTGNGTCVVSMTAPTTVTSSFVLGTNSMTVAKSGNGTGTVTSVPAGINCGTTCSSNFSNGTTVTLTATPATGSTFTGWSGGGCTGTGTCVVTISTAVTITAQFTLQQFALNVTSNGNGSGTVTSSPAGISCPTGCTSNYNYGDSVTLTASPAAGSTFAGWTGGGCTGTGTCVVNISAVTNVTATFNLLTYTLTVIPAGNGTGTVTSSPAGINCGGTCSQAYNSGTTVTLTAANATGSTFTGWSGGGCAGTGTCVVTMSAATNVTATFTLNTYALSVTYTGPASSGSVTSSPGTINCVSGGGTCSQSFNYNTLVTLTATPAVGFVFNGWSGGGCTGTGSCQVTMTAATSVTATFAIATFQLSVNLAGNGAGNTGGAGSGVVTSSPVGVNCGANCSATYNYNTMVTLTEAVGTGTTFTGWSGACSGTATTCTVTMTQARSVTATFTLVQYTLAVTLGGTGAGSVTSNPAGINCGATCSKPFDYGTVVTLTESPQYGSTFTNWSGGTTTSTLNLTMTSNQSTTATFTKIPPNYMFVTSTSATPGSLNGFAGADSMCQTAAQNSGLPGTYHAYLSSSTTTAASRLGSATGWIRPDGKPFANTQADLMTGRVFSPPRIENNGVDILEASIPTATMNNGVYDNAGDCAGYTSTTGSIDGGTSDSGSFMWFDYVGLSCNTPSHFYCFGVDNQAVVIPPTVSNVRRAFMRLWTPGGGIADADASCQATAQAAGLTGTYKALLATTAGSAISRFDTSAAALPWARVDNMVTLPTANAWTTAAYLDVGPNLSADGATTWDNYYHWSGATSVTTVGTAATTCSNWTSQAQTAYAGIAGFSKLANGLFGAGNPQCNFNFAAITCLQQ